MDFEQFEGIVEIDETYFLYSEKGKRGIQTENPLNVVGNLNIEVSATNKFVFLLPETVQKQPYNTCPY